MLDVEGGSQEGSTTSEVDYNVNENTSPIGRLAESVVELLLADAHWLLRLKA